MTIAEFDHLPTEKKRELLKQCCGSEAWVNKMITIFPVEDLVEFLESAEEKWYECTEEDWKEAFEHHPQIGDINSLKQRFANTAEWAAAEQAGINDSSDEVLQNLAEGNKLYQNKFGYIFIISASGKSAGEILTRLELRLPNSAEAEINMAAEEQNKITKIRLEKLFS